MNNGSKYKKIKQVEYWISIAKNNTTFQTIYYKPPPPHEILGSAPDF
jgi:hypothetical protein